MIWVLHILAAVFFFPALFVTIPAHLIMNRMPQPDASDQPLTDDQLAAQHSSRIGGVVALAVIALVFIFA